MFFIFEKFNVFSFFEKQMFSIIEKFKFFTFSKQMFLIIEIFKKNSFLKNSVVLNYSKIQCS